MGASHGLLLTAGRASRQGRRDYRTLLEINNAIIANLTRDALFHAIAGALQRVLSFERTAIFLHETRRNVLRLFVLEASMPSTYFGVDLELAPDESHVGGVFQRRRPLLRRDLPAERQFPAEEAALADGVRSPKSLCELPSPCQALRNRLQRENVCLQEEIPSAGTNVVGMVGSSPALLDVLAKVASVGCVDGMVLVLGETRTGKDLIARAIHERSPLAERPW